MELQSLDKQITRIQEDINKEKERLQQLENQRDRILNRDKEKARKERTRRLIERGAILEKYFPVERFPDNQEIVQRLEAALAVERSKNSTERQRR